MSEYAVPWNEFDIINQIKDSDSMTDIAKLHKIMGYEFKTKQAGGEVKRLEKELVERIRSIGNNARRKSTFGWFILCLFITVIMFFIGVMLAGVGSLVAFLVVWFSWSAYIEKFKKAKQSNAEASENKRELQEFRSLFYIKDNHLVRR